MTKSVKDILDKYMGNISLKDCDIIRLKIELEDLVKAKEIQIYETKDSKETKSYVDFIKGDSKGCVLAKN